MNHRSNEKQVVLVTGASGLLGGALLRAAAGEWTVHGLSRRSGGDVTAAGSVERAVAAHPAARALIHLAAFTDVSAAHRESGDRAGLCYRTNVGGTQAVAAACRAAGIHLIHVSTDFVFAGDRSEPYTEEDETRPIEWYGKTKLESEEAAQGAGSWTIVRVAYPYVAPPAARPDLVATIRARLAAETGADLFDDQIITPTYGEDIARGLLLLAAKRPQGTLFHLAGATSLSPHALGLEIARTFGLDAARVRRASLAAHMKKDPRPRQRSLRISNARWCAFAARHGLAPPVGVAEGLKRIQEAGSE
ncbi:MAG: NAD(P)-dependent oxidoreductase [Planctomycetes bacterium]|nr:NAD(P)-dependent oxidoreductase [Planctomycetota bacterium]